MEKLHRLYALAWLLLVLCTLTAYTSSNNCGKIAFISDRDGKAQIYVMDADGSNVVNLTNDFFENWAPEWSPDGEKIAFQSDRDGNWEIYIMDVDGSNI